MSVLGNPKPILPGPWDRLVHHPQGGATAEPKWFSSAVQYRSIEPKSGSFHTSFGSVFVLFGSSLFFSNQVQISNTVEHSQFQ